MSITPASQRYARDKIITERGHPVTDPHTVDRQIAGQREQSHVASPRCAITLPPQKTSTRHSDQQRRSKDSRRKPGPLMRHNETAEQINSYSNHHGPDEPLDQTIRIAGRHTPRNLLSHTAKSRANRRIERQLPPGASTIRGRLRASIGLVNRAGDQDCDEHLPHVLIANTAIEQAMSQRP